MEDVPDFLSMDTDLSLADYFATANRANDVVSNISDEPWKEFSDGSDSGIDSKCIHQLAFTVSLRDLPSFSRIFAYS